MSHHCRRETCVIQLVRQPVSNACVHTFLFSFTMPLPTLATCYLSRLHVVAKPFNFAIYFFFFFLRPRCASVRPRGASATNGSEIRAVSRWKAAAFGLIRICLFRNLDCLNSKLGITLVDLQCLIQISIRESYSSPLLLL